MANDAGLVDGLITDYFGFRPEEPWGAGPMGAGPLLGYRRTRQRTTRTPAAGRGIHQSHTAMSRPVQFRLHAACIAADLLYPSRWSRIPFHLAGLSRALRGA